MDANVGIETMANDNFDIIAFNGFTGECLTTDDTDLEAIRQEHEAFLIDLEAAAVKALASGDWNDVESCIFFYNPQEKKYDV